MIRGRTLACGWMVTVVLVSALAPGCGDAKPSVPTSDQEATVSGSVTVLGKTATKGNVIFDPSNYQRKVAARRADIGKDGRYTIKTLLGANQVRVESPLIRNRELSDIEQTVDVKEGENTFDVKVPPDPVNAR